MTYCTRCGAAAVGYGQFCAVCGAEIVTPASGVRPAVEQQIGEADRSYSPEAEATPSAQPLTWRSQIWESGQLRGLVIAGFGSYVVTVVLSAVLAAAILLVSASLLNVLLGGSSTSSTGPAETSPGASGVGSSWQVFVAFTSLVFFASHFGPLEVSGLGGATFTILGIGSLSISFAAFLVPFFLARRVERRLPPSTAGWAFCRGTVLGGPYAVGAAALYLLSFVSVGDQQLGLSIHPSLLGVLLAVLITSCGGGLGAASIRTVQGALAASLVRAASRASAAIAIGMTATTVIALAWIVSSALTHSSGAIPSDGGTSASSAVQQLGWALSGLIPFYLLNSIALTWLATLEGSLFSSSPSHQLLYIGPLLGVVLGALRLRRPADRLEQGAYAASFTVGVGLLAVAVTPAIVNGASLLPNPWLGVLVALIGGVISAVAAPYLLEVEPVRAFVSGAPTWAMRPVIGLWPADAVYSSPDQPRAPSKLVGLPAQLRLHVSRIYAALAIALLVLVSGGLVANSQLSSRFSPEAAAVAYLTAQSRGDPDGMWALMALNSQPSSSLTPFLTKDALRAMLALPANRDIAAFSVASSIRQSNGDYLVNVRLTESGRPFTSELRIRKDRDHTNWLVYPDWRIVIVPSVLTITTYPQAGEVSLDSIPAEVGGKGSVEVIPGLHKVAIAATDIFASDSQTVDASSNIAISFDIQLSGAASAAVNRAVNAYFGQCAQMTQLSPQGCPNAVAPLGNHQARIHWSLVGDPSANVHLSSSDAIDAIVATGAWQMHVSFDYWFSAGNARVKRWDQDIGGNFGLGLAWNGAAFDVASHSGSSSAATSGASSVPVPSITVVLQGSSLSGSPSWLVVGQYFTPGQRVEVFLYQPPTAPNFVSANAPNLAVRADGTFSGSFELASHPGPAKVKACDTAGICATVLVTAP